jgi:hypothetical protein
MNVEGRKLELIHWIYQLNNEDVLSRLEFFKRTGNDWGTSLPTEVRDSVRLSERQFNAGDTKTHASQLKKLHKLL